MAKVILEGLAPPDSPIYTGELMVGARLTKPMKSAPIKETKIIKEKEVKSSDSAGSRHTLLELALSKGFTIVDPNDPIYKDGFTIVATPLLTEKEEIQRKYESGKDTKKSRKNT